MKNFHWRYAGSFYAILRWWGRVEPDLKNLCQLSSKCLILCWSNCQRKVEDLRRGWVAAAGCCLCRSGGRGCFPKFTNPCMHSQLPPLHWIHPAALHQEDYPPAPIQALEYPQCPAPGQLCSESVLCTIRHHVFLALDLPHTRSVLHPAYIYMATKHCLSDFLACSLSPNLTFSDSLGLAPPQQNQPGTVASLLTMYCDYQEQSSVTPQTQGKVQPDKVTCTITRNWRKNAAVIGSSTTPQAMFTNTRHKLNCEDKLGKGF